MQLFPLFLIVKNNSSFRNVLYSHKHSQLVLMSLEPDDGLGPERPDEDILFIWLFGDGEVTVEGEQQNAAAGDALYIGAGVEYSITNVGKEPMKLVAVYSPPRYKEGLSEGSKISAIVDPYNVEEP